MGSNLSESEYLSMILLTTGKTGTLLLIFVAFGFSTILSDYPSFLSYIGLIGGLFIMYMGYKIATSTPSLELKNSDENLKFYEGFLLQWLNPKAWIGTISGVSLFSTNNLSLIVFIIIYFIVCYLSLSFWGILGQRATIFLNTTLRLKLFNLIMGSILILSAISLVIININT